MALTQITTDGIKDGTITGSDLATNVDLVDNQKLRFGTGNDLQIFHDGSNSFINEVGTGGLFVRCQNNFNLQKAGTSDFMIKATTDGNVELYSANSRKLQTDTHGITVFRDTGDAFTIVTALENSSSADAAIRLSVSNDSARGMIQFGDSSDADVGNIMYQHNDERMRFYVGAADQFEANTDGIQLDDNKKAQFGNSSDLQIYHDGSHSYIADTGTGNLNVTASRVNINNAANSENIARFIQDGAVELYYDSNKKFETQANGATLFGYLNVGSGTSNWGFLANDSTRIGLGTSQDLILQHDGTDSIINNSTGSLKFQRSGTTKILFDTNGDLGFVDNRKAYFGDGADLQIYHDGSNSVLLDNGTGNLKIYSNGAGVDIQKSNGENIARFITDGAVELYFDNSKKLATASDGITVYGRIAADELDMGDNEIVKLGASDDLQIFHDGSNSHISSSTGQLFLSSSNSNAWLRCNEGGILSQDGSEYMIRASSNDSVKIFYDNSKKFETTSGGVSVTGTVSCDGVSMGDNEVVSLGNSSDLKLYHDSGANYVGSPNSQSVVLFTNNTSRWMVQGDGHMRPLANNTYDIGTTSMRVRNIYTNDLNLSNEGGANDVDGTWGSYTIQEGAEDLFLVNKRSGKKYKFNLTEVS